MEQEPITKYLTNKYERPIRLSSDFPQLKGVILQPSDTVMFSTILPPEYKLYEFNIMRGNEVIGIFIGIVLKEV